ncbi:MAG: hypothetical protein A2806_00430 [Candidatus Terrybacteria bacterium RIFCSPHIGHO2_01_FULL_48_17]|uniref:Uncharacterized protein n=1 Tax=Candidatus Terrybacteria bacterium RIFCSPHIGHO2_01_FULL_48_17 TaxID=1802362 RepID=A0A1G2PLU4_9BACT|nr:MAG: hypothetical protein A2806_00430 [Candidatus Terrybacteria bacterium RIFCSPHIGHO2_01_FULL_48_17]OHA53679.1 MAG: hypothetical protein A3A30_00755 [Candidatus Terrybacteria bacterium RIFCSPLOWO2_01_FULL_48_14]
MSLLDRFSRHSRRERVHAVDPTHEVSGASFHIALDDDPSDMPTSQGEDLSGVPDEDGEFPDSAKADFARNAAELLKELGASHELTNWFFKVVGPGQFQESLEVAQKLLGFFGGDRSAALLAEATLRGMISCTCDRDDCHRRGLPWYLAKDALRAAGFDRGNPFSSREQARRGWRVVRGAEAALMHRLVCPDDEEPAPNVGYVVEPQNKQDTAEEE